MNIVAIELSTDNLLYTELFYRELLCFKVLEKNEKMIRFKAGKSVLTFRFDMSFVRPTYHFAFNIPNNQLKAAVEWLTNRVYLLPIDPEKSRYVADFSSWNAKAIYFRDNNGNILEFIARFDLDNQSEIPFTGQSVTCISEIGIVTIDVVECIRKLTEAHDIELYTKQAPQDRFAALGNDDGLLIISETGRNWFPTSTPCKKFPLKVTVKNSGQIFQLLLNQ